MAWILKENEMKHMLSADGPKRYEYFIHRIADTQIVWGLYDDGWASVADNNENKMIPFWPHEEYAKAYIDESWKNYKPKQISIDDFMDQWLPGMKKDGVLCAIFPVQSKGGIPVDPERVLENLKEEIEKY